MDALTLKVNLDCLRKDSQAIINAKVGEANGRKVVFTLYEGRTAFFVPAGASVIFRAQKPDGTILYNNCVIDDGKVEYTITSQTVAVAGVYACELQIVSDGRIIYSPYVTLNVMDNLYADTEVESSNEFTELENALNKIPSLEVIYSKQDKLIAGENITIADDGKTISAKGVGVLEVTLTTQNGVSTADKTFEQVKAAVDSGIPVLKVYSDGAISWFFLLDKSPTEVDFVGLVDEQIIAYLTAKQDGTWESNIAARVTAEMFSSLNNKLGNLNDLDTQAKNNLVAAINEAAQSGGGGGSTSIAMRVDGGYVQYSTDNGKTWVNLIAEADLKGDKGDKGADGVNGVPGKDGAPGIYYGTTQPTGDTHPVWIDPDGGPDDGGLLPAVTADDNGKVLRVVSSAWSAQEMPSALPNPYALTFTGAVTGSYDGSAPLSVEIPSGGGSGSDISLGLTGATVGQIAKITAVDDTGKPTAWEPVDMPTGGGNSNNFEKVVEMTTLEDAAVISIGTDKNGNPLSMSEFYVAITTARNNAATKNNHFSCNVLPDTVPKYIRDKSALNNFQLFQDVYCHVMHCKVLGGMIFYEYIERARTASSLNVAKYLENEKEINVKADNVSSIGTIGFLTPLESENGVSKINSASKMYCITFDASTTECIFGAGTRVEVWAI